MTPVGSHRPPNQKSMTLLYKFLWDCGYSLSSYGCYSVHWVILSHCFQVLEHLIHYHIDTHTSIIQFDSGSFVVRVNNEVLEPSGQLLVEDETTGGETAFPWWGILLVCVGGIALIIIVLVLVSVSHSARAFHLYIQVQEFLR